MGEHSVSRQRRRDLTAVDARSRLRVIKLVHTAIWTFFAAATIAIPFSAWLAAWRTTILLIALVSVECLVLVMNRLRCPLTGIAALYTDDRRDNFDIYLPAWLARHNKHVFGSLFVAGLLVALYRWRL
jgi:hypothetical protein